MLRRLLVALASLAVVAVGVAWALLPKDGFSAKAEPSRIEAVAARLARRLAVPRAARDESNPVPLTNAVLARARAHFADHCATCHGNDAKGQTDYGRNLYPKAPDMTATETQSLSDGEIFWVITNGVRLSGMPAFGSERSESASETWELVHFIRNLKKLTPEEVAEMESLNPKSRKQLEEEEAIRRFLAGAGEQPMAAEGKHKH